jgi:uncharacterized phage protein gp47/JayE
MFTVPSYQELVQEAQDRLKVSLPEITNYSESSVVGAIIKVLMLHLSEAWQALGYAYDQMSISSAVGDNLDRIAELFGLQRMRSTRADTISSASALKFTNNSSTSVVIPAGTRVFDPSRPLVSYFTVTDLSLGPGETGYVHARAADVGPAYNVASNVLTAHDLLDPNITVTNPAPITTGQSEESDESLRYRIREAAAAVSGSNEAAVKLALMSIPGVRDVKLLPCARGAGTLDVVILPAARHATPDFIALCQNVLANVVAAGISAKIVVPKEREVTIVLKLSLDSEVLQDSGRASSVRTLVGTRVQSFIDNLLIEDGTGSGEIIYNDLVGVIMDVDGVRDVQIEIYIDGARVLNTNQRCRPGERFVLKALSVR